MRATSYTLSIAVVGLVLCGCGDGTQDSTTDASSQRPGAATAPEQPAGAPAATPAPAQTQTPTTATPGADGISTTAAAAVELPVLFEQLEKPDYKAAYMQLFDGDAATPAWMKEGGTASPGRVVTIGGTEYELYSHCKPHDCGDNMMYVLFSRDRKHAWALVVESGKPRFLLVNPDGAEADALIAEACKDRVSEAC